MRIEEPENSMIDRATYEKELLQQVLSSMLNNSGEKFLSSIILTGSFGRDEPTYSMGDDGLFHLKSDIEVALIVRKFQNRKKISEFIYTVTQEFSEELNLMPISEVRMKKGQNFNYSLCPSKYKTIFTFDLYNGSKTIWGKNFLEEKVVHIADVDPYEAKRLVANRIGELCWRGSSTGYVQAYWKGKLMLALASAWLILRQEYVSSYHGQYNRLKSSKTMVNQDLGDSFFEEYERVFYFLRDNGSFCEVPDDMLKSYVGRMDSLLNIYQTKRPKVNSLSRYFKYVLKYAKTGMHYGISSFEDNILQSLISQYYQNSSRINETATVWHKVLY